jgi:MoxR-like ATPase
MPKLVIPRGTKPRALMLLAGVSYPGGLPSDMVTPQPGATISIRTALRYAMRCTGATREDVANATLSALRAFYVGDAMRAALAADAWRHDGQQPQVEDEDDEPAPAPVPAPVAPAPAATGLDALLGGIVHAQVTAAVEAALAARPALDREAIAAIARDAAQVIRVEVQQPGEPPRPVPGLHHERFPALLRYLSLGLNVYLHGPAGSGKSSAAKAAAEALGLAFASTGKVDSKYDLLGFRDAHGRVIRTPFREVWQAGGVFLLDEMDRSDPAAVLALNNGLATGALDFPDGTVAKHADTRIVAGGNTRLSGGDRNYVGAIAQDASVQDRFTFLFWGYDERLERAIAGEDQLDWTLFVQRVRKAAAKVKVDLLATPRSSITGALLLRAGVDRAEVEEAVLWKGLDPSTVAKVRAEAEG